MYVVFKRKTIVYVLSGVLVLFMGIVIISGMTANRAVMTNADVNWGLSFNSADGIPTGNASAEKLKTYNAYYTGDTKDKKIYLTFDAGYENGYTEKILDVLKNHNTKATFFLVGNFLEIFYRLIFEENNYALLRLI